MKNEPKKEKINKGANKGMPRGNAKHKYNSPEFLEMVESLAKKGMNDKEIALSIGLSPGYFSEKKSNVTELSDVLMRARAQINSLVRQKYLSIGLGGIKTKTTIKRAIQQDDGSVMETDLLQVTEMEHPPNPAVLGQWLFHHDEEWRQLTIEGKKLDVTTNGENINQITIFEIPDNGREENK